MVKKILKFISSKSKILFDLDYPSRKQYVVAGRVGRGA